MSLDPDALQNLLDIGGGDQTFVDEVLQLYVDQADELLDHLQLSVRAADRDAVRRWAHTLKGASLNVGATTVAALCREIEERASKGICASQREVQALIAAAARVRQVVAVTVS